MFKTMFEKALNSSKISKKVDNAICPIKKVDNNSLDVSFENIHKINKKCTPKKIMYYQMSLKPFLHNLQT